MSKTIFTIFMFLVATVHGKKMVPCFFVFGDSLVDNGNNNDRDTVANANFLPYGIDYPNGPTGRFTNGRNVADFIAEALGFADHIPSFATANGDDAVVNGTNYASGSAGILSETGKEFGDVISFDEQLQNHQTTIARITSMLGSSRAAKKHLGQCIYYVGMGSNDYAAYTMNPTRPSPDQYASLLIDNYSLQLRLYGYGARKVAVFGLGSIGCVPAAYYMYGTLCMSATKTTSGVFNTKLRSLINLLNQDLVGAKFTYINTFGIAASKNSSFEYPNLECCTVTPGGTCVPLGIVCPDRACFAYFDGFHPTEAAAAVLAKRAFAARSPSDAHPFDIQHLVHAK
ncbi:GDSL esterase/lipase At1g29670-like isoform X2 [Salvia splendens]|uniref:GDSL esterase/lipase At1g29670-like isoform X2 n=1 Tax=Salvia splendens TaxID=180675 RepID=UPI001C256EDC|nr:GDSL esterase/lipase At1g29670-like isoform X2 [Salvia splendens]